MKECDPSEKKYYGEHQLIPGMTLRDYFAAVTLGSEICQLAENYAQRAIIAYKQADAMMNIRESKP